MFWTNQVKNAAKLTEVDRLRVKGSNGLLNLGFDLLDAILAKVAGVELLEIVHDSGDLILDYKRVSYWWSGT